MSTSWPAPPGCSRARRWTQRLDYLFIDEAGQVSLADALAIGTTARNADPARRPAPARAGLPGSPPRGRGRFGARAPAGRAADDPAGPRHLPRAHPPDASRRLRVRLGGRLRGAARHSTPPARGRRPASAPGIRYLPVEHEATRSRRSRRPRSSPPRSAGCSAAATPTPTASSRRLDRERLPRRRALQRPGALPARARCPTASRVGTVDKFQGQEAPVVFFSMATLERRRRPAQPRVPASAGTASTSPSRARAASRYLVASPKLLEIRLPNDRPDATRERPLPASSRWRRSKHTPPLLEASCRNETRRRSGRDGVRRRSRRRAL